MEHLTTKDLTALSEVLRGEEIGCKKARIYAATLTDTALAESFSALSKEHERRFSELTALIGGKK